MLSPGHVEIPENRVDDGPLREVPPGLWPFGEDLGADARVPSIDSDFSNEEEEDEAEESEAYQSLHHIQRKILKRHAKDVRDSQAIRKSIGYHLTSHPFWAIFSSFLQVISHTSVVLFSNPMAPLTDSTNYFYALLLYVFIYVILTFSTCGLIVLYFLRIDMLIHRLSSKYARNLSIPAWADCEMFTNQKDTFDAARKVLGGLLDERDTPSRTPVRLHFNCEVAKAILLMSSILYERNTEEIKRAFDYSEEALKYLLKSEEKIYNLGNEWGCNFVSIADFQTAQGPFAGAFYDIETGPVPFIVLVFKGTSPHAWSEWVVDISFNLEASADRLGGGFAHQGFYSSLFPRAGKADRLQPSPHLRILETIETIASEAYIKTGKRTNLFVGGHSLGAGIASLFYARLLESPEDLGCHTVLRDAYCFGTPRACGASLASRFEYNLAKPKNHHRTLWRVSNKSRFSWVGDIVTRVPPGLADTRMSRSALREGSLLSYAAIGTPITLLPGSCSPFYKFGKIPSGYKVSVYRSKSKNDDIQTKQRSLNGPIKSLDSILKFSFPMIHDHFPGCYLDSLNKLSVDKIVK